jgi:hypothetical protein
MAELEDGKLNVGQQFPAHPPQRRQAGAVVTRFARFNATRSEACGRGGGLQTENCRQNARDGEEVNDFSICDE